MIIDGLDLSKTLFYQKKSPREQMFFYKGDELFAVRLNNLKLHFRTTDWFKKPVSHNPPLLFDLDKDPSEKYDIYQKNEDKIKEILKLVEKHNKKMIRGENQLINRL